ncbi:hypothetical protein HKX48_007192 [Thoreauomyces humboldtii]|nr:hypothetical protein HKX48_007192 [Thoreauomyces humboldtii]
MGLLLTCFAVALAALATRYVYLLLTVNQVRRTADGALIPPMLPDIVPVLGPLAGAGYLVDPLKFVLDNHARFGDIFSATVLGKTLTFVQGQDFLQSYGSATEADLSLLEAYKVMLGKLVGHDVFQKIGKEIYAALSTSRVERNMPAVVQMSVAEVEREFAAAVQQENRTIDISEFANVAVVRIAVTVLCSAETANQHGAQLAKDLNLLESDHSPLAIMTNFETALSRRRAAAKARIFQTFKDVALEHLEKLKLGLQTPEEGGFISYLIHYRFGTEKPSGKPESTTLPEFVMRDMSKEEYDETLHGLVLLLYGMVFGAHTNTVMSTVSVLLDLLQNPKTLAAVRHEASGLPDVTSTDFSLKDHVLLNEACTESWRLRSSGGLWRQVVHDGFRLGEYALHKGTLVTVNQGVVNRNASIYGGGLGDFDVSRVASSNLEVDPLTQSPSTLSSKTQALAFGFGRHVCPGRLLAYRIVGALVVTMLRYDLEVVQAPTKWMRLPTAGIDRAMGNTHIRVGKMIRS